MRARNIAARWHYQPARHPSQTPAMSRVMAWCAAQGPELADKRAVDASKEHSSEMALPTCNAPVVNPGNVQGDGLVGLPKGLSSPTDGLLPGKTGRSCLRRRYRPAGSSRRVLRPPRLQFGRREAPQGPGEARRQVRQASARVKNPVHQPNTPVKKNSHKKRPKSRIKNPALGA
jgi:hypothetical protein